MLLRLGLTFIALVFLLQGCSKTSFLGKRFDNFTAYYNTFYNAKKQYNVGVDALERTSNEEIDRDRYLSVFVTPDRVSSQQNFNDAIIKSADVLRDSPSSKWVDDALLLIGKSYFYLQNYVGAEEKFTEVINLGGALQDEARFWLGRTYLASNALDQAGDHLEVSLARDGLSSQWEPMLRMVLAELYVKREAWPDAARELDLGLQRLKDKELGARAQFLLGQIYESMQEYERALHAFTRVPRYKPEYALIYAARISEVRIETDHGDPEKALRLLRGMERDDKNFDSRAEMGYFRGRIFKALGESDTAFDTFDGLLYSEDRTMNISSMRGHIHYALGELIRDDFIDYPYAAAHFDTAHTSLGSQQRSNRNARQEQFTPEAIIDSENQAEILGSFADVFNQIVVFDSLLWLGEMDEEAFDEFILELRKEEARIIAEEQRELARREAEKRFNNTAAQGNRFNQRGPVGNNVGFGEPTSDQGFLFHKDRIRVQEGLQNFLLLWGERPLVPNWRRMEAIQNATLEETEGEESTAITGTLIQAELSEDFLPVIDYSDVPRDSLSRVAMLNDRALSRYELANVLFLSMERPDSAASWYRLVISDAEDQPVAQRAFYALAEVQQALGDDVSAERLYREVLERYPESDFADQVRERLGLPVVVEAETDSSAIAESAYLKAYQLWQEENYERAATDMVLLASNHQSPDVVPRALLAASTIYLEWASRDQLDVYALPSPAVPDSILLAYGLVDSVYVFPRGAAFNEGLPFAESKEAVALQNMLRANRPLRALIAEQVMEADSMRNRADVLLTQSDSLYTLSDQYYGQSDSLQSLSDAMYNQSEQLKNSADSLITEAGSLDANTVDVLANEGVAVPHADSLRSLGLFEEELALDDSSLEGVITTDTEASFLDERAKAFKLDQLLHAIKQKYPATSHAEYADRMLKGLEELRPVQDTLAIADSLAIPAQDSLLVQDAGELTATDSTSLSVQDSTVMRSQPALAGDRGGRDPVVDEGDESSEIERMMRSSEEPFDASGVGWTLVVASFAEEARAREVIEEYQQKGFRAGLVEGSGRFRVGLGQFSNLEQAKMAREIYRTDLPPSTWFLDLENPK